MSIQYSVVIPVYNEEESVEPLENSLRETMEGLKEPYEIIFINDGSTDGTLGRLRELRKANPHLNILTLEQNSGQTVSLKLGFGMANGEIVISMDGDLQNDPKDIPMLINKLKEGYDAVCGWRRHRHDSLWKKAASRTGNIVQKAVFRSSLHDISCTLRAYKKEALKNLDLGKNGAHRFIPYLLIKDGRRLGEVEVNHRVRKYGKSKYSPAKIFKTTSDFFRLLITKRL